MIAFQRRQPLSLASLTRFRVRVFCGNEEGTAAMTDELWERLMAFDQGRLSEQDVIRLFQQLIDEGHAWRLQGAYGRTAQALLDAGLCHHSPTPDDRKPCNESEPDELA